jgi:hypothetical protein
MIDLEQVISIYNQAREACFKIMPENPAVLGDDEWLKFAIKENDIQLEFTNGHVSCYGTCYTTQTQSYENFEFIIPTEAVYKEVGS